MNVTVSRDYLSKHHLPILDGLTELLYVTAHAEVRTRCGATVRPFRVHRLEYVAVEDRCVKCYGVPQ